MVINNKHTNVINFKKIGIKQDIKRICCENCYKINVGNLIDMRCSSCNKLSEIDWRIQEIEKILSE